MKGRLTHLESCHSCKVGLEGGGRVHIGSGPCKREVGVDSKDLECRHVGLEGGGRVHGRLKGRRTHFD